MMKLYIAHVGFYDNEIGIYELHSNLLIAAPNIKSARDSLKSKDIYIKRQMHIDGIEEVVNVDGYEVKLEKSTNAITNKIFSHEDLKALG